MISSWNTSFSQLVNLFCKKYIALEFFFLRSLKSARENILKLPHGKIKITVKDFFKAYVCHGCVGPELFSSSYGKVSQCFQGPVLRGTELSTFKSLRGSVYDKLINFIISSLEIKAETASSELLVMENMLQQSGAVGGPHRVRCCHAEKISDFDITYTCQNQELPRSRQWNHTRKLV